RQVGFDPCRRHARIARLRGRLPPRRADARAGGDLPRSRKPRSRAGHGSRSDVTREKAPFALFLFPCLYSRYSCLPIAVRCFVARIATYTTSEVAITAVR